MILSFDPATGLAGAAVIAYALSALGRPLGTTPAQAVALALHAAALVARFWIEAASGDGLRFGFGPVLSLTVWLVLAVHLAESRLVPLAGLRRMFSLAGAAAVVLALVFPGDVHVAGATKLAPLHWALGIASYGLFGVAVLHAMLLDAAERRMRQRGPDLADASGAMGMPLLSLESLTFHFVEAGFAVLTLAIVLGLTSVGQWRFDHKTVLSLMGWATFAALIVGRRTRGWRGRQATRWVYAGGVLMLLAYAGSRFVFEVVLNRTPT
jgi:ABC-type uncharacterized transport system permease subunit